LHVWFLAEHVIDMTRARAVMADGCFFDVTPYALIAVGGSPESFLCQNCVRYSLKPRSDTVIYGATPMHIVVAGSRWWELR
jgi:hypothetical protein